MLHPASSPAEFAGEVLTATVLPGVSVLSLTLAGLAVAGAIGVTRWAFQKALGRA